jgi:hypothetical protein
VNGHLIFVNNDIQYDPARKNRGYFSDSGESDTLKDISYDKEGEQSSETYHNLSNRLAVDSSRCFGDRSEVETCPKLTSRVASPVSSNNTATRRELTIEGHIIEEENTEQTVSPTPNLQPENQLFSFGDEQESRL